MSFMLFGLPIQVCKSRMQILGKMLDYISVCVASTDGAESFTELNDKIFSMCAQQIIVGADSADSDCITQYQSQTEVLLTKAIVKAMKWHRINEIELFHSGNCRLSPNCTKDISTTQCYWEMPTEPSVVAAFRVANDNITRMNSAIVYYAAIRDLLPQTIHMDGSKIFNALFHRRREFINHLMIFGGLVGGDIAQQALKQACHLTCYDPMGSAFDTVRFLMPLGATPHRYSTTYSQKFDTAIKEEYDHL